MTDITESSMHMCVRYRLTILDEAWYLSPAGNTQR